MWGLKGGLWVGPTVAQDMFALLRVVLQIEVDSTGDTSQQQQTFPKQTTTLKNCDD